MSYGDVQAVYGALAPLHWVGALGFVEKVKCAEGEFVKAGGPESIVTLARATGAATSSIAIERSTERRARIRRPSSHRCMPRGNAWPRNLGDFSCTARSSGRPCAARA